MSTKGRPRFSEGVVLLWFRPLLHLAPLKGQGLGDIDIVWAPVPHSSISQTHHQSQEQDIVNPTSSTSYRARSVFLCSSCGLCTPQLIIEAIINHPGTSSRPDCLVYETPLRTAMTTRGRNERLYVIGLSVLRPEGSR